MVISAYLFKGEDRAAADLEHRLEIPQSKRLKNLLAHDTEGSRAPGKSSHYQRGAGREKWTFLLTHRGR
ncbi:hypothetical protein BgiBS90_017541 [Biomphalaria glabrata]|nr:hypothetical protein BgiBS90_017541 [Biomphalaria glabrata]